MGPGLTQQASLVAFCGGAIIEKTKKKRALGYKMSAPTWPALSIPALCALSVSTGAQLSKCKIDRSVRV